MRVLIAEDSPDIALMLTTVIEHAAPEIEVSTITNRFEALLTPGPWEGVDVAVIDLMLPKVDGEQIVRYLADSHPDIKRVVLSAVAHQRPDLEDLATCISKPVHVRTLLGALGVRPDE